jgi:hypothetical protein
MPRGDIEASYHSIKQCFVASDADGVVEFYYVIWRGA